MTDEQGSHTRWAELVASATLGTARHAAPVGGVVAGVPLPPQPQPERALLVAAAAAGAAQRASLVPVGGADPGPAWAPPDEEEDRPEAGDRASQLLALVLEPGIIGATRRRRLLAHWVRAAARAGVRVPAALLAPLCTAAREPLRDEGLDDVLGARGRWLVQRNPEWAALAAPPEQRAPAPPPPPPTDAGHRPTSAWAGGGMTITDVVAELAEEPVQLLELARAVIAEEDARWATALLPALLAHRSAGPDPGAGLAAWSQAVAGVAEHVPAPWSPTTAADVLSWALSHPTPAVALLDLAEVLVDKPDRTFDGVLAPHEAYRGAGRDAVVRTITRIRTARSLHHEIDDALPPTTRPTRRTTP